MSRRLVGECVPSPVQSQQCPRYLKIIIFKILSANFVHNHRPRLYYQRLHVGQRWQCRVDRRARRPSGMSVDHFSISFARARMVMSMKAYDFLHFAPVVLSDNFSGYRACLGCIF